MNEWSSLIVSLIKYATFICHTSLYFVRRNIKNTFIKFKWMQRWANHIRKEKPLHGSVPTFKQIFFKAIDADSKWKKESSFQECRKHFLLTLTKRKHFFAPESFIFFQFHFVSLSAWNGRCNMKHLYA